MAGKWKHIRVDEVAQRTATGPFGSAISSKHFCDSGVPVIRGSNLSQDIGTRLVDEGMTFVSEEKAEEFSRSEARPGDLVFTCWGTIDQVGLIDHRARYKRYIVSNKQMLLTPDASRADSLFLYYTFSSPANRAAILNRGIGSSVPGFNLGQLRAFEIDIPPLVTPKAIAAVLGALDDKIELNRRMNATLEAMARALFQSWFVDFDPVRAKLDGRKPDGMDKATVALFPSSFQDSPIGLIPHGWEVKRIDEVVEGVYDGPHATPSTSDTGPIFLGIGNLTGTALDLSDIRHINEDEWARWTKRVTPKAGDIVFSYEATLGFFAIIPPDIRCCLGRRLALVRPLERDGFPHFWFQQFVSLPFQQFLDQHTIQGATVDRIPLIAFPSYPVLNPPTELKAAFGRFAEPFWRRIHANQAESRTLAAIRDTLLPKLLSGELCASN
jgi:type I restriction enzyme S subunit